MSPLTGPTIEKNFGYIHLAPTELAISAVFTQLLKVE